MMKKRIATILALAIVSTVSPLVYQYVVEPRMEGANVDITILGMQYNSDESSNASTAFTVYLKLENKEENDVIVSPLQLDMYYRSGDDNRYRLIGELTTNEDFLVPGTDSVGKDGDNFVASKLVGSEPERDDSNTKTYNRDKEIKGVIYFYKKSGFVEGANEALVDLINNREDGIDLKFSGNAQFGPISIPIETPDITLKIEQGIIDPEIIIYDLFLYQDPNIKTDTFVVHTLMRNPSGLPVIMEEFELELFNKTGKQQGWAKNSIDIATSFDPTETSKKLSDVFLDGAVSYEFSSDEIWTWRDVFFAFNFTDPDDPSSKEHISWFLSKMMDESSFSDITLKGPATIILGQRGKGFVVDMNEEDNYLQLDEVTLYQKYLPKYGDKGKYTGRDPIKMFGNFTIGQLTVDKMVIDTKQETMRLDISGEMLLSNPYRFEYSIDDFEAKYVHSEGGLFGKSAEPMNNKKIWPAYRDPLSLNPLLVQPNTTSIELNLTTLYNTHNKDAAIYKVIEELGGDSNLLNLTNPFYIDKNKYPEEYNKNPFNTIEYIIDQDVNPLTLLNEVELKRVSRDYMPLRGSFFGNSTRPESEVYKQPASGSDMPYLQDPLYGGDSNFAYSSSTGFNLMPSLANWDAYYDEPASNGFEDKLGMPNQYEIIDYTFNPNWFTEDEDNSMAGISVSGIITEAPKPTQHRDGSFSLTPMSDVVWRIYEDGGGSNLWGPVYDYFGYGDKGWAFGMDLANGERCHLAQDFTFNPDRFRNEDNNIDSNVIRKATLSISYKYLDSGYWSVAQNTADTAYLMFSLWNYSNNEYDYRSWSGGGNDNAFKGRNGWALPFTPGEWNHLTIDLTDVIKNRISDYAGTLNPDYLKAEVGFAGWGADTTHDLRIHFDDIVLNIEVYDYPDANLNTSSMLNLEDLFEYLNQIYHEAGNMFNILYKLSDSGDMDNMDWWEYLAKDGVDRNGDGEVDFFKYLQFSNVSLSTITDILQNKYVDLGVGEPANFLQSLTKTKYSPLDPSKTPSQNKIDPRYRDTKYGPRLLNEGNWVLEDPLNASRALVQSLHRNIFRDETSQITRGDFSEEELWYMLDCLDVSMPWVIMYLLSKGWTKDDIFDVLFALGLGQETKYDLADQDDDGLGDIDFGVLSTFIHVDGSGVLGIVNIHDDILVELDMDPVLDDGIQELFSVLCSASAGGSARRYIVNNHGDVDMDPYYTRADGSAWPFDITFELWIDVLWFEIQIAVDPDPNHLIATPPISEAPTYDDYIELGSGGIRGLNDAGTQQLASNLRMNYMFNGAPFINNGGDPVSLFQFLDTFYFSTIDGIDYSSLAVLHYFNVSGLDFIDIITGYNANSEKHDPNGNGLADDWRAPDSYGAGNRGDSTFQGWGTSFWHNSLYWGPDYDFTGQEDGAIIWSDCPDFVDMSTTPVNKEYYHSNGLIYPGSLPYGDEINKTAPPIVDLFDMLFWISEASGTPDPNTLVEWLLGELDSEYYRVMDPRAGIGQVGGLSGGSEVDPSDYKQLTNQELWRTFRQTSLNATGFFEWLEVGKNINSFKFLYVLNQTTNTFGPLDLLFFATSPNLVRFFDGAVTLYYHEALDSQGTLANDYLWEFFLTDTFDVEKFFQYLDDNGYNIFDMFIALQIDPASWLKILNLKYGLEPIEVIKRMKKVVPGYFYLELDDDGSSTFNIYANMSITYQGTTLKTIPNKHVGENKVLTTEYHFSNFIRAERLKGENFVII